MVTATIGGVIGTGLALGIVHVLTGPDHLSALATLSVGKTWRAAFGLGVRWGCGHSFGLLIVAIIFFAVGQSINIDTLTYWADMFVGIFMIVLGVWYVFKAYKDRKNLENTSELHEEAQLIKENSPNSNNNSSNNNNENSENNDNKNNNRNDASNNTSAIAMETIDIELETTNIDKSKETNNNNNNTNNKSNTYQNDLKYQTKHIDNNNNNNNNNNNHKDEHTDEDTSNHSETMNSQTSSDTATTATSATSNSSSSNSSGSSNSETQDNDSKMDESATNKADNNNNNKEQQTEKDKDNDSNNNNENENNEHEHIGGDALIGTLGTFSDAITNVIVDDDDDVEMAESLGYSEDTRRNKCMTRIMAFVAGVFHGIAGPGGVLGVMVALKLDSWLYSSLYMFIFFISSICTMGVYAIAYGFATQRMTLCANNKHLCAFYLKCVSALFSIIVGVLWLTLTFTGTLDEIFD